MMLAEVKLLMEDKISGDKEKGEETPTTRTKCVHRRIGCASSASLTERASRRRSVFQKTYGYVKRFSYPNATVETAQSIRECAALALAQVLHWLCAPALPAAVS